MSKRELPERFNANINKTKRCWLWTGATDSKGYGKISVDSSGRLMSAHRLSYIFKYGKILDGLCVLHHCDNPLCVNPEHLFLGTQADNIKDMDSKRRRISWKPFLFEMSYSKTSSSTRTFY